MERIIERCAGLDVHRDTVVATARVPAENDGRRQQTRTFGTTTSQLLELSEWLTGLGVTLAGMEATGVYWKPVFWVLEDHVECWAAQRQASPGMSRAGCGNLECGAHRAVTGRRAKVAACQIRARLTFSRSFHS
jgi:hypothetical protein